MPDSLIAVALPGRRDPASVFRAIAAPSRQCFWLDAGPDAGTGWSWVGIGVVEDRPERIRDVELTSTPAQSPWEAGRFRGGWIGWLGYEGAAERAGAPVSIADADVPGERWLRVERFVAFDHEHGRAWAVAPADEVETFAASVSTGTGALAATRLEAVEATARHEPGEYADLIERCRDAIREGDAYQLCLTTRFTVDGARRPCRRLRAPADDDPGPPRRLHPLGRCRARERESRAVPRGRGWRRPHAPDQGHPAPRCGSRVGRGARRRAAGERQGARGEHHDRRPDAQRPLAGVRAGVGRRRRAPRGRVLSRCAPARQHGVRHPDGGRHAWASCWTRPSRPGA